MATYTTELKRVIESVFGSSMDPDDYEQEYHNVSYEGINYGKLPVVPDWTGIGLGTYPIFDEKYRDVLNGKIVDEYFNREIGTETIDNFLLVLRKKMDQIMPYYNKLYLSEKISFDPLATYDITTTASNTSDEQSTSNGSATSNSGTNAKARAVSQELPQTLLSGNGDYATSASDSNSETTVNGENTQNASSNTNVNGSNTSNTTGFQGVASELLMRYRNSIINIDVMILREIEDCFMLVLNNGSSYEQNGWYY